MKHRAAAMLTALGMLCGGLSAAAAPEISLIAAAEEEKASSGISVEYHTKDEIIAYIRQHPTSKSKAPAFETVPSYNAPYELGKLDSASMENYLNALNIVRYVAGIDEVTLSDRYCERAQGASLVNAVNGVLSHTPGQPDGMSDALYDICNKGAASSNISLGYANLTEAIFSGYMVDAGSPILGHRRWCINPTMLETGFGFADGNCSMYVYDRSRQSSSRGVCWPAQNMPVELFGADHAWNISMGYQVSESDVNVTLTRKNDGREWHFSSGSADGTFFIDNADYGLKGCIIFCPDGIAAYSADDEFTVSITGLEEPVHYTVSFFSSGLADEKNEQLRLGDLNADDLVNAADAAQILIAAAQIGAGDKSGLTAQQEKAADLNTDGSINASDAAIVLMYAAAYGAGQTDVQITDFIK